MTSTQKAIAVLGLVAIAATLLVAPFDGRLAGRVIGPSGEMLPVDWQRTLYGPAWSPPSFTTLGDTSRPLVLGEQSRVRLDAGKLGLWWAGIALVTIVGIVVAAPSHAPARPAQE